MNKDFKERLKIGNEFEEQIFPIFQYFNQIKHSSDKVIWIGNQPIFIEFKSSPYIEAKSWEDQLEILNKGYKVVIVFQKNAKVYADWIENIKVTGPYSGMSGSYDDFYYLYSKRMLSQFSQEAIFTKQ